MFIGRTNRLLAVVSLVTFTLAVIVTDGNHCVDACEPCHLDTGEASPNHTPHQELHTASNDGKAMPASSCPGATCLCHQPRVSPGDHPICLSDVYALTTLTASPSLELEVTDEILHVPKRIV